MDVQYLDGCEVEEREVEERGGEVYLKPWVYPNLQCCVVLQRYRTTFQNHLYSPHLDLPTTTGYANS